MAVHADLDSISCPNNEEASQEINPATLPRGGGKGARAIGRQWIFSCLPDFQIKNG